MENTEPNEQEEVLTKRLKTEHEHFNSTIKTEADLSFSTNLDDSFAYATAPLHTDNNQARDNNNTYDKVNVTDIMTTILTDGTNSTCDNDVEMKQGGEYIPATPADSYPASTAPLDNIFFPSVSASSGDKKNNNATHDVSDKLTDNIGVLGEVDVDTPVYGANEQRAAEDIVRKLCKNGKLMEFQEGEDFIKVIVYEDSQDGNDTQSADEGDGPEQNNNHSRNLLECLTESGKDGHLHSQQGSNSIYPPARRSIPLSAVSKVPILGNQLYNTPHPQTGNYMMYSNKTEQVTPKGIIHQRNPSVTPTSARMLTPGSKLATLNSSGEEVSPPDALLAPKHIQNRVRSMMQLPQFEEDNGKVREQHNQKERRRRYEIEARIKEACNLLRQLVPGMSDKTDKATVFEFAARYVHFLKSHTGAQYDKDFLMKYSPY